MTAIITLLSIIILFQYIRIKSLQIRIAEEHLADDWDRIDKHSWTNGDCCRCEECTERFTKELMK